MNGSTVALVVGMDYKEIREPTLADGSPIPPPHEWKNCCAVPLTDPDYLRGYYMARRGLVNWFNRKFTNPVSRNDKKKAFNRRFAFWAHVLSDYALWSRVDDDSRPKTWPRNTAEVARFHGLTVGELSVVMSRVGFKSYMRKMFPPIPHHLFIEKLDKVVMKNALRQDLWDKHPDKAKAIAELAYRRYNIIRTGGAGIQITNTNAAAEQSVRDVPNEAALAKALALVAPYMPRLIAHQEVPVAEEETGSAAEADQPGPDRGEPDPEGDGQA